MISAPDLFVNILPHFPPGLITFAGPKTGLDSFVYQFNRFIKSCFRVVNCLDVIPCLPPYPYEHVGTAIDVDSGGWIGPLYRHSLYAYQAGLQRLVG